MKLNNITKGFIAFGVMFAFFFILYFLSAGPSGFAVLDLGVFSTDYGSCEGCTLGKSLELANTHSPLNDSGLTAYWQFESGKNGSFLDSVSERKLVGKAEKSNDRIYFGGDSLEAQCDLQCSGVPVGDACSLFSTKNSCESFKGKNSCSWSDLCSGELTCSNQNDKAACSALPGCSWNVRVCEGVPENDCEDFGSREKCIGFNSHSGECSWKGPCKGIITCNQLENWADCSIVNGCYWTGTSATAGLCEGGFSSCAQWDNDRTECNSHSSCLWEGPCSGVLSCEAQKDIVSCEAIPGCSADSKFPASGADSWSQFAWIRIPAGSTKISLFGIGDEVFSNRGAYLKVDIEGKIYIDFNGDKLYSDTKVNNALWHYVGAVYEGKYVELYSDGKKVGEKNITLDLKCNGFRVGSKSNPSGFKGEIDEIKLYNFALSDEKILNNYEFGLFEPKGVFISRVFDLEQPSAVVSANWSFKGDNSKAVVQFKLSNDKNMAGDWGREYSEPGGLNLGYGRYLQYRVKLETSDLTETPELSSLKIEYKPKDSTLVFIEPSDTGTIKKNSITVSLSSPKQVDDYIISLYKGENLIKKVNGKSETVFDGLKDGKYNIVASSSKYGKITREVTIVSNPEKKGKIRLPISKLEKAQMWAGNQTLNSGEREQDGNPLTGLIKSTADSLVE